MIDLEYEIRFLPIFREDFMGIINYISNDLKNPKAAERLIQKVTNEILNRSCYPKAFEPYPSRHDRNNVYYRIYVDNYIIFYIVKDNIMEIHRIVYNKTDYTNYV